MEDFPPRIIEGPSNFIWSRSDGIENNHRFNMQWLYIQFWIRRFHAVSAEIRRKRNKPNIQSVSTSVLLNYLFFVVDDDDWNAFQMFALPTEELLRWLWAQFVICFSPLSVRAIAFKITIVHSLSQAFPTVEHITTELANFSCYTSGLRCVFNIWWG